MHIEKISDKNEKIPTHSCDDRDCNENLFGYCQSPKMKDGVCTIYKKGDGHGKDKLE